jgi:hypothetical protein
MKLTNINEWLGLTANVGVIAGIAFLAMEISQNTTAIKAEIYQTRAYEVANANDMRAESNFIVPIRDKLRDESGNLDLSLLSELSPIEKQRLWLETEGMIRRFDNNLYQCEIGFLDEYFCNEFEQQTRTNFPVWQAIAHSVGSQVNPAFRLIYGTLD